MRDLYRSFTELRARHLEGVDFDRVLLSRPKAKVVVLAPHGGRLENHTDEIAKAVAGADFSLYCFCSKLGRYQPNLHITSHRFDDPDCVSMVAGHRWAVSVHGCSTAGERVFLGGRDRQLIEELAQSLVQAGIQTDVAGHAYPGTHPNNIVNRTATGMGAQIEMSMLLRRSEAAEVFVASIRKVLLAKQTAA